MNEYKASVGSPRASLEVLYNVSKQLAAALDLASVLQQVLFLSLKYLKAASGSLIVLDSEGAPLDSAIIHEGKFYEATNERLRFTLEEGLAGWVVKHRQAALVEDTGKDE